MSKARRRLGASARHLDFAFSSIMVNFALFKLLYIIYYYNNI